MMKEFYLSRFTPSLLQPETLEAILVQRGDLAARLVELIRESVLTENKHYMLLVGPRGTGKTHMVSLVYHRVRAQADLRDRLRIAWLREEEWGVASFLDFLLAVLRALHEESQNEQLAKNCEHLRTLSIEAAERGAEQLLLQTVGDRTLLVIAENLDEIFNALEEEGQRKLRAYIQNNPMFAILATSQSLFSGVSVRESPFYGFFQAYHLAELSFEDAVTMMAKIARHEGDEKLASLIHTPRGRARIRAVHHLAGGNPRVYVIFSQFLTCDSLDQLVEPLMQTLDDLTPYYQARMSHLSPQQRKIVDFLCQRRHAVPVAEIAQDNFVTHQTASGQLKKLRELGYVRAHQVGRESYYELREPLLRISLEVKKVRGEPIRLLVAFLRVWYSQTELVDRLKSLKSDRTLDREYLQRAIELAAEESDDPRITACLKDYEDHEKNGDHEASLAVAEELVAIRGYPSDWMKQARCLRNLNRDAEAKDSEKNALELDLQTAATWLDRASVLIDLERFEEVLACYDKALDLGADNASISRNRGIILEKVGRYEEALASYDKAIELNPDDALAWKWRATLLEELNRYEEALKSYDKAIELDPNDAFAWRHRSTPLKELNRYEETLKSYDKAIKLDPNNASTWVSRGMALRELNRNEEALASYDKAIDLDANEALAWSVRASLLEAMGRYDDALASVDKSLEIERTDTTRRAFRGLLVWRLGRREESLAALEEVLKLDPDNDAVWGLRGVVLSSLGRDEEALTCFDRSLELGAGDIYFDVCSNRAMTLAMLGRWDEGVSALDEALRRFAEEGGVDACGEGSIVRNLLIRTQDVATWRRHITTWIELFDKHGVLPALGQGLVRSVRTLVLSSIGNEAARAWRDVWEELGTGHKELEIPLRLLDTAVRYQENPDERILLGLPIEERELLKPLLGLGE